MRGRHFKHACRKLTKFDEFILFSGDADFTPVIRRVRSYDRQTTILTTNAAATAYKAACDKLIPVASFVQRALASGPPVPFPARGVVKNGRAQSA
ncbi:NYN domain-containing protein [bacterium]|nr:NYN domain-containing protein [bacterium]